MEGENAPYDLESGPAVDGDDTLYAWYGTGQKNRSAEFYLSLGIA